MDEIRDVLLIVKHYLIDWYFVNKSEIVGGSNFLGIFKPNKIPVSWKTLGTSGDYLIVSWRWLLLLFHLARCFACPDCFSTPPWFHSPVITYASFELYLHCFSVLIFAISLPSLSFNFLIFPYLLCCKHYGFEGVICLLAFLNFCSLL